MNGHEKSDPIVVAMKPANKAGQPVAEWVERRVGTKGNAGQHNTHRAQNRESVTQALARVRQACASPSNTRGRSRMRAIRTYGSVRGALSKGRSYRDTYGSQFGHLICYGKVIRASAERRFAGLNPAVPMTALALRGHGLRHLHRNLSIMRNTMLTTAVLLGLTAMPAFAQTPMMTTQTPPSPNSSQSGPQPDGSLPASGETSEYRLPGSQLGTQQVAPGQAPAGQRAATTALKTRLAAVGAALHSNDFGAARREFATFHNGWDGPVEHDVEARLKPEYARFEQAEGVLNTHLVNAAAPDRAKALDAVQAITDVLDRYLAVLPG